MGKNEILSNNKKWKKGKKTWEKQWNSRLWKQGRIKETRWQGVRWVQKAVLHYHSLSQSDVHVSSLQQIIIKSISDNLKKEWRKKSPPMLIRIAQEPIHSKLAKNQPAKVVLIKLHVHQDKSNKIQPSRSSMINYQESNIKLWSFREKEELAKAQLLLN